MTNVLIVDDQSPFRVAARLAASRIDGWAVVGEAESGEAGVAAVADLEPDLVLMDINMDGIDGFEATRQILERHPSTVVFLVSTYALADLPEDPSSCGAAAYIRKDDLSPAVLDDQWRRNRAGLTP